MNVENLQRMADYIKTIPQENFDMSQYRDYDDYRSMECKSIGCVIGHCIVLEDKNIALPRTSDGEIMFSSWSEKFTGLDAVSDEWDWCFNGLWEKSDNTAIGASKRIEWMLNHGLPKNWIKQMYGEEKLCYNE